MLSLHTYIHTYIHTYVRMYIHTYIHKLYLNTNLSVAKKAETKVKLSDKSPNSHEKKETYLNVTMTCTHAYINFI